jgi:hypothetical protein
MGIGPVAKRGALAAVVLAALCGAWYFAAEKLSLAADRIHTAPMQFVQASPFGWNGTSLQFEAAIPGLLGLTGFNSGAPLRGEHLLGLTGRGPDYKQVATLEMDGNGKLVLSDGNRAFVLGASAGTIEGDDGPVPAFAAEPGDTASLTLERSLLGWPIPPSLAGTYLSGAPTTWARHLYYRLFWTKPSGARLVMVWRCEQEYERINGWHNLGAEELIKVEIEAR